MPVEEQHTILLSQYNDSAGAKIWEDYECLSQAIDGVIQMFERQLKKTNPDKRQITYDIRDLFGYIDELTDLGLMLLDPEKQVYKAKGKKWIKKQILTHLKEQANSS